MALLLIPALAAQAATITYTGQLTGAKENPGNDSPGTGTATAIYDPAAHTLQLLTEFSDLEGTTTIAHIHCCIAPPGTTIPATPTPSLPAFPAGVQAGSYDHTLDLTDAASYNPAFLSGLGGGTAAGAEAALVGGLNAGHAYFNIHSTEYPGGEIRDFLAAVPEPGATLLLGAGLLGLAFRMRRRKL